MKKIIVALFIMSSLSLAYEMDYTKDTVCEVRQFKVYKEPRWVSKIELQNGKKVFFSSPKSMFEFYLRPGKWFNVGVKSEKDFKDILVTDYNSLKPIEARASFFVYGSRAHSPAGDDLVAFDSYKEATEFAKDYSGKRVFKFREISQALVNLINGRI